jgi:hypothetical protein
MLASPFGLQLQRFVFIDVDVSPEFLPLRTGVRWLSDARLEG